MKWSIGAKIITMQILSTLIFAASIVILFQQMHEKSVINYWVNHTQEVVGSVEAAKAHMYHVVAAERAFFILGTEKFLNVYKESLADLGKTLTHIKELTADNQSQQERYRLGLDIYQNRLSELDKLMELRKQSGSEKTTELMNQTLVHDYNTQMITLLNAMETEEQNLLVKRKMDQELAEVSALRMAIIAALCAIIFLMIASTYIIRSIATPLKNISSLADRIALGELNLELTTTDRKDEVGQLTRSFSKMIEKLKKIANFSATLRESSDLLVKTISEIMTKMSESSTALAETASAVRETTVTVEEVRQTAHTSSQRAKHVLDSATQAVEVSQNGKKMVGDSLQGMNEIKRQMSAISENIMKLSEQTQAVGEILTSVNDLAEQSNLLSVNASIEAARAGEQGRSFAIVAKEVKGLADQSKKATNQVRAILNEMLKAANKAVLSSEQGIKTVDEGLKQVSQSGDIISLLAEKLADASQASTQIALSSQQQLTGVDQVAIAMTSIGQAGDQNVAGTKQVEASTQNLNKIAEALRSLSREFQV